MYINRLNCCGIKEIDCLGDYEHDLEAGLLEVARLVFTEYDCAYLLFSEVRKDRDSGEKGTYGFEFKKLIEKFKLGRVVATNSKTNPNSDNLIRAYIWELDRKALKKWALKQNSKLFDN